MPDGDQASDHAPAPWHPSSWSPQPGRSPRSRGAQALSVRMCSPQVQHRDIGLPAYTHAPDREPQPWGSKPSPPVPASQRLQGEPVTPLQASLASRGRAVEPAGQSRAPGRAQAASLPARSSSAGVTKQRRSRSQREFRAKPRRTRQAHCSAGQVEAPGPPPHVTAAGNVPLPMPRHDTHQEHPVPKCWARNLSKGQALGRGRRFWPPLHSLAG